MKIGITGATGFIGSHVAEQARHRGHQVVAFSRSPDRPKSGFSETRQFSTDATPDLTGLDAIVHLAGESIMGLWTPPKKRRIRESRIAGTRRIVESLATSPDGPKIFVCGSATGFYGDTGEIVANESSPNGRGFLADVARLWETEADRAPDFVRTTKLRTGFVLGDGGAMKLIGPVFKTGLGGRLGDGQQWMSCIHVDDVAGLILHAVENDAVSGPLNAVMPEPVRNAEFTHVTARAARRPALITAPKFLLKLTLGELSHLLLDSQRVVPSVPLASGYTYHYPSVNAAMAAILSPTD